MKILLVEDQPVMRASLTDELNSNGHSVTAASSYKNALALEEGHLRSLDCAILDKKLPDGDGILLGSALRQRHPFLELVMLTGYGDAKSEREALDRGFFGFLGKPEQDKLDEWLLLLSEHIAEKRKTLASLGAGILGECKAISDLRKLITTVAPTDARVLVLGESGTGKELVAGALHNLSHRVEAGYVRINCAAIPETLLESEVFGHERGAFTGAIRQKPGRVEEADGGTLFLDEIADMSRPLQAKLLRFLEDGSFTRVGGTQELRVKVRLIAATNRDIVKAIADQEFREDLFHRLNVVRKRHACDPLDRATAGAP